jgi:hypothetical protein
MMLPPMCPKMIKSTVSRETRRGKRRGKDYHSTECFDVGHWVTPQINNAPTTILADTNRFFIWAWPGTLAMREIGNARAREKQFRLGAR